MLPRRRRTRAGGPPPAAVRGHRSNHGRGRRAGAWCRHTPVASSRRGRRSGCDAAGTRHRAPGGPASPARRPPGAVEPVASAISSWDRPSTSVCHNTSRNVGGSDWKACCNTATSSRRANGSISTARWPDAMSASASGSNVLLRPRRRPAAVALVAHRRHQVGAEAVAGTLAARDDREHGREDLRHDVVGIRRVAQERAGERTCGTDMALVELDVGIAIAAPHRVEKVCIVRPPVLPRHQSYPGIPCSTP